MAENMATEVAELTTAGKKDPLMTAVAFFVATEAIGWWIAWGCLGILTGMVGTQGLGVFKSIFPAMGNLLALSLIWLTGLGVAWAVGTKLVRKAFEQHGIALGANKDRTGAKGSILGGVAFLAIAAVTFVPGLYAGTMMSFAQPAFNQSMQVLGEYAMYNGVINPVTADGVASKPVDCQVRNTMATRAERSWTGKGADTITGMVRPLDHGVPAVLSMSMFKGNYLAGCLSAKQLFAENLAWQKVNQADLQQMPWLVSHLPMGYQTGKFVTLASLGQIMTNKASLTKSSWCEAQGMRQAKRAGTNPEQMVALATYCRRLPGAEQAVTSPSDYVLPSDWNKGTQGKPQQG